MLNATLLAELSWWWLRHPTWSDVTTNAWPPNCSTSAWPANLRDQWNDDLGSGGYDARPHILSGASGSPEQPMGIGVGCVLVSALLIALGANLVRHAAGKERLHRLPHQQRCYLCQPEWIVGVLLLAVGHAGTFVAFFFAADWLVSLLGLSALLWNVLLARALNAESIGCLQCALPLLFILCGLSAVVIFAHPPSVALWTAAEMNSRWREQLLTQPFWIAHGAATLSLLLVTLGCDLRLGCSQAAYVQRRVSREHWKAAKREAKEAASAGGFGDTPSARTKTSSAALQRTVRARHFAFLPAKAHLMVDTSVQQLSRCEVKVLRVLYPASAALLAGWSAVLATCLGELLRTSLRYPGVPAFNTYLTSPHEVLFLLLGATVPLPVQVHLLTRSLCFFEAQAVLPIFYVGFVATAVGASGVFFGTFRWECYTWQLAPLLGGLALAVLGALMLTCLRRALPKGAGSVEPASGGDADGPEDADDLANPSTRTPPELGGAADAEAAVRARAAKDEAIASAFDEADENKDGKLNREEFANFLEITAQLPGMAPGGMAPAAGAAAGPVAMMPWPPSMQQLPNAPPLPPSSLPPMPPSSLAPWREPNRRAPTVQLPPLPMVQRAPPPTPAGTLPLPLGPAEAGAAADERAYLQAELGAQQAQIVQLQHAILDLYTQQERAATMGGGPPASGDGALVYDHALNRLVPGSITATSGGLGHGGMVDTSSGRDPAKWEVPDGTQAGQVFMVDGKYYVAVAVPATQRPGALPPIPPALPGLMGP